MGMLLLYKIVNKSGDESVPQGVLLNNLEDWCSRIMWVDRVEHAC